MMNKRIEMLSKGLEVLKKGLEMLKKLWQTRKGKIAMGIFAFLVVLILFAGGRAGDEVSSDAPRCTVQRGDMVISILQSGELAAKKSRDILNEASGNAKIVYIVDDGTYVTNGQLLVELESSDLQDRYLQQKSSVASAEADLNHSQEALEIAKLQHNTDLESAKLKVQLAKLTLNEYKEAEYPQQVLKAQSDITLAKQQLEQAKGELQGTQELFDKDFSSQLELQSAKLKVDQLNIQVQNKTKDLEILKNYTYVKTLKQNQNNVKTAEAELERLQKSFSAELSQNEAQIEAKKTALSIQKNQLATRKTQLDNATIHADFNGQVFYPTERWRRQTQIEKGATVNYRQRILSYPDLSSWNLKVGIPEAMIDKVAKGQEAVATVDALPGLVLHGTISKVSAVPDNQGWFSTGVKTYTIIIDVTSKTKAKLKPGMSANVEIVTDQLRNVLYVPIQSVFSDKDNHYVYVIKHNRKELRKVEIGKYNDLNIEIRSGLKAGEELLLYAKVQADKDAKLKNSPLDQERRNGTKENKEQP